MRHRWTRRFHRGVQATQLAIVLGALALAILVGVRTLGTNTRDDLEATGKQVGDPSKLVGRFSK